MAVSPLEQLGHTPGDARQREQGEAPACKDAHREPENEFQEYPAYCECKQDEQQICNRHWLNSSPLL